MKFLFNPAVSVHAFDGSSKEPVALCETPSTGNKTNKYVIPLDMLEILKQFDGCRETAEVITAYQNSHPGRHSTKSIENLINSFLVPKGLLIAPDAEAPPRVEPARRDSFLYLKLPLISSKTVAPIARALSWLFIRPILFGLLGFFIAGHVAFYAAVVPGYHFSLNDIRGHEVLAIFALSTLAALIHELGHASALYFHNRKGAEIGWGLYLIYPVLYTDVSDAWRLKRSERAVINIAGVYFQCMPLFVLALIFLYTQSPILLVAIIVIDLEIIGSLNPFLRNDGYWLVADFFGIHNLRQRSFDLLERLLTKIAPLGNRTALPAWNLSRNASVVLGAYLSTGGVFTLYLFKIVAHQILYQLLPNYPSMLLAFGAAISRRPFELLPAVGAFFDIFWKSLVLLGFILFVYRTSAAVFRGLKLMVKYLRVNGKTKGK